MSAASRPPAPIGQPGIERVRLRLQAERPELLAAGVHVVITELADGDLILGDTHEYGWAVSPFTSCELDELVLAEARQLLGVCHLEVRERWQGVYPYAPGHPFMITAPLPGARVVEVVGGVGMPTALGARAPLVLDELLSTVSRPCSEGHGPPHAVPRPSGGACPGC